MEINPQGRLAKLYMQHAVKAGMALNDAKHRIEDLHENTKSEKLNELGRTADRHSSVCEAILATAHELLDGDSFMALCRDLQIERWAVDEALKNMHADLPELPT